MLMRSEILRLRAAKDYVRAPCSWPGAYPLALITADGGCLCQCCARTDWRLICVESFEQTNCGFRVSGVGVNWENTELDCDQCGRRMKSAYGEDE